MVTIFLIKDKKLDLSWSHLVNLNSRPCWRKIHYSNQLNLLKVEVKVIATHFIWIKPTCLKKTHASCRPLYTINLPEFLVTIFLIKDRKLDLSWSHLINLNSRPCWRKIHYSNQLNLLKAELTMYEDAGWKETVISWHLIHHPLSKLIKRAYFELGTFLQT